MKPELRETLKEAAKEMTTFPDVSSPMKFFIKLGLPLLVGVIFAHWFGTDFAVAALLILMIMTAIVGLGFLYLSKHD